MEYICKYCGRVCKNNNSLKQHEVRCKKNPNHIICYGNKGNMPEHIKRYYNSKHVMSNGDVLDISRSDLQKYRDEHKKCEICGRTIEEAVKWTSEYAPKKLCVDHDHTTKKFRGLLCSVCNRQLGWYEKNKENIEKYLNKSK